MTPAPKPHVVRCIACNEKQDGRISTTCRKCRHQGMYVHTWEGHRNEFWRADEPAKTGKR
jgi:hypothetical protein